MIQKLNFPFFEAFKISVDPNLEKDPHPCSPWPNLASIVAKLNGCKVFFFPFSFFHFFHHLFDFLSLCCDEHQGQGSNPPSHSHKSSNPPSFLDDKDSDDSDVSEMANNTISTKHPNQPKNHPTPHQNSSGLRTSSTLMSLLNQAAARENLDETHCAMGLKAVI